jgi:hypothetical protein
MPVYTQKAGPAAHKETRPDAAPSEPGKWEGAIGSLAVVAPGHGPSHPRVLPSVAGRLTSGKVRNDSLGVLQGLYFSSPARFCPG